MCLWEADAVMVLFLKEEGSTCNVAVMENWWQWERNRNVKTTHVSTDRKKGPLKPGHRQVMCLNLLLKELFHSFCVWWVLMLSQESGWFILWGLIKHDVLCHFLGEHREIIVLFQENLHTKLLKVVQDLILFLLMLRNLLSIFVSSFEDWEGSSCPPVFEKQMPASFSSAFPSQRDNGIVQLLTAQQIWFLEGWPSYTWQY